MCVFHCCKVTAFSARFQISGCDKVPFSAKRRKKLRHNKIKAITSKMNSLLLVLYTLSGMSFCGIPSPTFVVAFAFFKKICKFSCLFKKTLVYLHPNYTSKVCFSWY